LMVFEMDLFIPFGPFICFASIAVIGFCLVADYLDGMPRAMATLAPIPTDIAGIK
jgi:hypothetical protein